MRSSHRLALIAAVALAGAAAAPGRDVVVDAPAAEEPSVEARPGDAPVRFGERGGSARAGSPWVAGGGGKRREASFRVRSLAPTGTRLAETRSPDTGVEGGVHWIGVFEAPGEPLFAAGGIDLSAPRELTLWKLDELRRHATPVTHLRSEVGRPFLAEHLLLSARGARLVAAPRGSDPFGPLASTILEVPPRDASRRESP